MTLQLMPYQDYRASGLPWAARIPANWTVQRVGALLDQRNDTGFPDLPVLEVSLRTGVRVRNFDESKRKQMMSDAGKYKRAAQGDIAYNMMRMWQGAVGIAPVDGLVSPAYVVARPRPNASARYLSYLFRTEAFMAEVNKYSHGIVADRNRLYWDEFKQMPVLCPPLAEQNAIADFLDWHGHQVNRYIRAKRKLITLLNEQKQAIIHKRVTRGLDPNVKLKPSDSIWVPDIPEHWEVWRLKFVADVQTGLTLGKGYSGDLEERPYLRVANVQNGFLKLDTITSVKVPRSEISSCELRPGDVLMTEGGDIDKLGRGCLWNGEITGCLHQNHVFAVRSNQSKLIPEFLSQVIASRYGREYFLRTAKQTTNLASTNSTTLGDFPLALPPLEEQRAIIDAVTEETSGLETAIRQTEQEVELVQEYHRSIVTLSITGYLDVSGHPLNWTEVPVDVAHDFAGPIIAAEAECVDEDELVYADD